MALCRLEGASALGGHPFPQPALVSRLGSPGHSSSSPQAQALYFLMGDAGVHFDLGGSAFLFLLNSNPHHFHLGYVVNCFRGKDLKKTFSGPVMVTAQYLRKRCC